MKRKTLDEQVWSIAEYNAKIAAAVKFSLKRTPWLTYDEKQLKASIKAGYEWLKECTQKQEETLGTIIRCTCRSLIYQGLVVKVKSKLSTTQTWQWRSGAEDKDSSATIITGDVVVSSEQSKEFLRKNGCVRPAKLKELIEQK